MEIHDVLRFKEVFAGTFLETFRGMLKIHVKFLEKSGTVPVFFGNESQLVRSINSTGKLIFLHSK